MEAVYTNRDAPPVDTLDKSGGSELMPAFCGSCMDTFPPYDNNLQPSNIVLPARFTMPTLALGRYLDQISGGQAIWLV